VEDAYLRVHAVSELQVLAEVSVERASGKSMKKLSRAISSTKVFGAERSNGDG